MGERGRGEGGRDIKHYGNCGPLIIFGSSQGDNKMSGKGGDGTKKDVAGPHGGAQGGPSSQGVCALSYFINGFYHHFQELNTCISYFFR